MCAGVSYRLRPLAFTSEINKFMRSATFPANEPLIPPAKLNYGLACASAQHLSTSLICE